MKKERQFYLDFVRAVAVVSILLTHYNACFLFIEQPQFHKMVITWRVANLYIGDFGVTLFFIISGAALMLTYGDKLDLVPFYKKRFLSIYPMFWMAYAIAFLFEFYTRGVPAGIPHCNMLLSVIGFDGLALSAGVPTYYLLGEWFLGFIVLFYLIFPLLRYTFVRWPIPTSVVVVVMYGATLYLNHGPMPMATVLTTRLPEILFGMAFVRYIKKADWKIGLPCLIILVANTLLAPTFNKSIQTTYVGIAAFLFLVFLAEYAGRLTGIRRICGILSKYSYAIFLVHHVVISKMIAKYDVMTMTRTQSYLLFMTIMMVVAVLSYLLFRLHAAVMKELKGWKRAQAN